MKITLDKRYKRFPLISIETKKHCFVILLWAGNPKRWSRWKIKTGFYNKTFKFHPFEMTVYF